MKSQLRVPLVLVAVAVISCSESEFEPDLGMNELTLDSSETLTVQRSVPSMAVAIDYIPADQVVVGGVALHSYVDYRLALSPLERVPEGCPIPCTAEDWERLEAMRNYPPLGLSLIATNRYVQFPESDGSLRALGRRNIRTAYTGEVVCSNPAWGQSAFQDRIEVYGEIALDTQDSELRVISCSEPGAGPIEATLTLWQYSDQ